MVSLQGVLAPIELAQLQGNLELVELLMEKYGCTIDYAILALQVKLLQIQFPNIHIVYQVTVLILLSIKGITNCWQFIGEDTGSWTRTATTLSGSN